MNSYGPMLTKKAIVIMLYYTNESFPCSSALPSMSQIIERFRIHDSTCKSFHMYSDSWQEFPVWTTKVKIPIHGNISSLNVSVASGIILYEAIRQRKN